MQKFKKLFAPIAISVMFLPSLFLTGCAENVDTHYNLTTNGTVYYDGEQTISLVPSEYNEYQTTFLSSITKNDISVDGTLKGKNIKNVTYISESEIKLTLDGKVTADSSKSETLGSIQVSHNALKNKANGVASLYVNFKPMMIVESARVTGRKYVSEYSLPYGSFISENLNTSNIDVPLVDAIDIELLAPNKLKIEVDNFTPFEYNGTKVDYPTAKLSANVTTFNKELYVAIGTLLVTYKLY